MEEIHLGACAELIVAERLGETGELLWNLRMLAIISLVQTSSLSITQVLLGSNGLLPVHSWFMCRTAVWSDLRSETFCVRLHINL